MCLYFNANTVSSHTNTHKRAGCTRLCKHLCVSDMGVDLYGLSAFPDVIRVTTGSIAWPLTFPDGDSPCLDQRTLKEHFLCVECVWESV